MEAAEPDTENLALRPGVRVRVSVANPTGGGSRSPFILLNETSNNLDGRDTTSFGQIHTFDTYDGQNQADGPDWYTFEFPAPVTCNCVEMTMGFPYRDGGWWTSLAVETRLEPGLSWQPVAHLECTPPYTFADERDERRPYETFVLTFADVTVRAIRLIGRAGGLAQFTSLARLAFYHRDVSRWHPAARLEPPTPHIFRLIPPSMISDFSESLSKLTGLTIFVPFMEYYLDETRYRQFWRRIAPIYHGDPDLWFLVADSLGWDTWRLIDRTAADVFPITHPRPHVRQVFFDMLATATAPVIVEGQILCELATQPVILKDTFDLEWHRSYAAEHGLQWHVYQAAIERSVHMSLEQLEGAADLMGMIANTVANLVHRNQALEHELTGARTAIQQRKEQRKELVRAAIDFMREQLETPVSVSDVARALALSLSHFCTVFTEQTGRNPSDYLIELRLERAREYLAHTDMSVLEVCDALGYDPSYFSRLFKRHVGCTPGQYAQRGRNR